MNIFQSNCFYSDQYLATIQVLKDSGLWDFESGILLVPIIQHCMPGPSIHSIHKLLCVLVKCNIDTDWAPLETLKKLKKKVYKYTLTTESKNQNNPGVNFPIASGIFRISRLTSWSTEAKRHAITELAETIHQKMGASSWLNKQELYTDVYQLRDILLIRTAKKYNLNITGDFTKNIATKKLRVAQITDNYDRVGNDKEFRRAGPNFWDSPPPSPFCISQKNISVTRNKTPTQHSDMTEQANPNNDNLMQNNQQQKVNLFSERARWSRNNVRSLADPSQLSWITVFQYWEFLLDEGSKEIFLLSLLSFLTGITKKRWLNGINSDELCLDSAHLNENKNSILLKVNSGATQFLKSDHKDSDCISLSLPEGLKITHKTIKSGLKDESRVRSFNNEFSGPSPYLNNIARSGHSLLRKNIKGETLAFIMQGRVPIEFKARSSYLNINNKQLNDLLNECLIALQKKANTLAKHYRLVNQQIMQLKASTNSDPAHGIGSQLSSQPWLFSSFDIRPYDDRDMNSYIHITNQMSLYYYWMLQFSLSARAKGEKTESKRYGNLWLHKDKNSDKYIETKLLFTPELLIKQKTELDLCVKKLINLAHLEGHCLDNKALNFDNTYFYTLVQNRIKAKTMMSKHALALAKSYWDLTPTLGRSNAHRHQCASYCYEQTDEMHTDVWQGHFIDGWHYASPESSSTSKILHEVLKTQESWLIKRGFHLVRNPLK